MKIIATGDWHITNKIPRNRKDDYSNTMQIKLQYILEYALKNKIGYVLQPGDFFDSAKAPHSLVGGVAELLREYDVQIVACYGQHDLQFHNIDNPNTPLGVLVKAGLVITPDNYGIENKVMIYTSSWGQEIPEIKSPNYYNILLTHRMVIDKEKLWDAQEDYEEGHILLRKHNFDLIVCGDNHNSFTNSSGGRHLINCGSLMRANTLQHNHTPHFFVIETTTNEMERVDIPIQDIDEVMDFSNKEKEQEKNERLDAFIKTINMPNSFDLQFSESVIKTMNRTKVSKGVRDIINEVLG